MPRKHRMTRADFDTMAAQRPFVVHGRLVSLVAAVLPEGEAARGACVVSKKVSASAVVRNSIERRCKEVLRPILFHMTSARILVIRAKKEAVTAEMAQIKEEIESLVTRILSEGRGASRSTNGKVQ